MKKNLKKPVMFLTVLFLICGCNSPAYDILEIEEKIDISNIPDTSSLSQNNNEIKEDLTADTKILENKFNDKQIVARVFAVQIGAFLIENNASKFTDNAKDVIDQSVYYKKYEGMFKVRTGNFNNVSEAINMLAKLKNLGYSDSFIVELTYVHNLDK